MDELQKTTLAVKGMSCASCSARIERVLSTIDGISSVSVNLAAETMDLAWEPAVIPLEEVAEKVKGLGFELEMPSDEVTLNLALKGMTCASCSARIEKVVSAMAGVRSMQVNLAAETGTAIFEPGTISKRKIVETIGSLGFEASPVAEEEDNPLARQQRETQEKLARMKQELIPAFGFAFVLLVLSMGEMLGMPLPGFLDPHHAPLNFAVVPAAAGPAGHVVRPQFLPEGISCPDPQVTHHGLPHCRRHRRGLYLFNLEPHRNSPGY